ncbi:MAG: BatD family protein [Bacteroidales bacterium]|nr:BatD family protein [Bacteroidales bacterium]
MRYYKVILTFLVLLGTVHLNARNSGFTASAPATVKTGQQFQYKIEGSQQGEVILPQVKDFELLGGPFTSFSSSTQWVNGKMTAKTTASYIYILRCNKPGTFTIPPAKVKVKKETFETNSVSIQVVGEQVSGTTGSNETQTGQQVQSESDQPVFLRILPSKREVYIGEQLVSELKVYTSVNTQPTSGMKEVPYEGFYKHTLDADQNSSRENINGKPHVTQVLQRHILIPQKAGKIVIEPYESEWAIPQRVSRGGSGFFDDPFNDPFFDRVRNVPVKIATKPVTINVKSLPENLPAGFTGGVGDLTMTATLNTEKVKVNDALSLVVKISGTGNIALIGAPEISFPPDHDVYETIKSTSISTRGNKVSGTVTFEYPLVARHAGNYRIAPVKFSWFDPSSETYKTIASSEFNFKVEKTDSIDAQGQIYMPGSRGEEVRNIGTDILDIKRSVPVFSTAGVTPLSGYMYWLAYLMMALLFILAIILLRTYFRQKADARLTRNRKASKMARGRLKIADRARKEGNSEKFFEETEKAVWGYLADKLSIEVSSLSLEKVSEIIKTAGVSGELQEELQKIIEECEFSRYAPSTQKADVDVLYNQTIELIRKLEQNIRSK